jgi:FAD/FMN-containing dehydrogenase
MVPTNPLDLSARLANIVGAVNVNTDDEERERSSFDAIDPGRLMARADATTARADVVVRPGNTSEVAGVIRLASEMGLAVVPYGGATGVMGR